MHRQAWTSLVAVPVLVAALAAPSFGAPGRQAQKHAVQHASAQPARTAMPAKEPLDLNSATREQLAALPGIGEAYSQKIIEGRPYKAKSDLKSRKVIPDKVYEQISKLVVARQAPK